MTRRLGARDAIAQIPDGSTLAVAGFRWSGSPEVLLRELGAAAREGVGPGDLTLIYSSQQGDNNSNGLEHLAVPGLLRRVIGGFWGVTKNLTAMALAGEIEAYNLPQGQIARLYGAIAAGQPGLLSRIGMDSFVDPRNGGGKLNDRTTEDLVDLIDVGGEPWLLYRSLPLDFGFVRGTTADESGNISFEKEAMSTEAQALAFAVRNSGGTVFAQVERIVPKGSIPPRDVMIPGYAVDGLIIAQNAEVDHRQCVASVYDPLLVGEGEGTAERAVEDVPLTRELIARRALQELLPGDRVNLGQGIPSVVSQLVRATPLEEQVYFTLESGVNGGLPRDVPDFGIADRPASIIRQDEQFTFYNGGGLTAGFLGFAQVDQAGNVNVSKFAGRFVGCGGFLDIAQPAERLVFCGAFTTGGLDIEIEDGRLVIRQEGRVKKFVEHVEHLTFSPVRGRAGEQSVLYVTERCVFSLTEYGLRLVEVAPGVDVDRDILAHMGFAPEILSTVGEMSLTTIERA